MFFRRKESEDLVPGLRLVVGLGNPGRRYDDTRHNVGKMAVRRLGERGNMQFRGSRQLAETARGSIEGTPVLLALPLTFMNESGLAVAKLSSYYKVPTGRMLIVCDDLDLPFGTLRLRPAGSSGGNNGLKSIIAELGRQDFARLRIGVGRPERSAISHVLGSFPPEQARMLIGLLDVALDAILVALKDGVEAAMNEYNRSWMPELESSIET